MMAPLDNATLEQLIQEVESDRAERKQSWSGSAPEKIREAVCAFANDLPNHDRPGVVFIGVRDDGIPTGIAVTDELLLTLAHIKTDGRIVPPPTITVEKRNLLAAEIAVLTVWPADAPPVRFDGRVWIRIGPRRGIATAQDERILTEKRRHRDKLFEATPVYGADLSDLSRLIFEQEYLPAAVAPDVLAANARTYEQRLAACGMTTSPDEPIPTVLGILSLGTTPRTWIPGNYIQFLRIRGASLGDPVVDSEEVDGTASLILRRIDDKLKAHLTLAVDYKSSSTEIRSTPYPVVALQQIVRNGVMHRTYEGTSAPLRVYWFDDRIEVLSPGGPYGIVNSSNFGAPGITDYRNPGLAGVMKVLGFVQRFGFGIGDARHALQENGNPPLEFVAESSHVLATIRAKL
jgi:ATP-dependent DNA helicase RecG